MKSTENPIDINVVAIEIGSRSTFQYVNEPITPRFIDNIDKVEVIIVVIQGVNIVRTIAMQINAKVTVDFVTGTIVSN